MEVHPEVDGWIHLPVPDLKWYCSPCAYQISEVELYAAGVERLAGWICGICNLTNHGQLVRGGYTCTVLGF